MRNSDLLLDDLDTNYHKGLTEEKRKSRCFQSVGIALLLVALLAIVGVFAFYAFPKAETSIAETGEPSSPFLRNPRLCDTCRQNPDVNDYVGCSSCGFDPSQDKTLKCPEGYGNMFITKAKYGPKQSAQIEGKIYTECKEQMSNGEALCTLNLMELMPELEDMHPPRPDFRGPKKEWMMKKEGWAGKPDPFFEPFELINMFDDLPMGPNGEGFMDDATEDDAQIIEALNNEEEIPTLEHLFLAMPHRPSERLERALSKCMQPRKGGAKMKPQCADGATLVKCGRGQEPRDPVCDNKPRGPICSDGKPAFCPDGLEPFQKHSKCWPEDGVGMPERPICQDGTKPKKCKNNKRGSPNPKCRPGKKFYCEDEQKPNCRDGFVKKRDAPKCMPNSGEGPNVHPVCSDGTEPKPCKLENGEIDPHCQKENGKKMRGRRRFCADDKRPECPANYSRGPCQGDGGFVQRVCPNETDEVIKCHKKEFKNEPNCKGKKRAVCKSGAEPTCPDGTTDMRPRGPGQTVNEQIFLSAHRPGQHKPSPTIIDNLPHGPNGESLLDHATKHDHEVIDALMDTQGINGVEDLFAAIPDEVEVSFKLGHALTRCMKEGDRTQTESLVCEGSSSLLRKGLCKGLVEGDELYDVCQAKKAAKKDGKYTPMCSDGQFAKCPAGYDSYTKVSPCISRDGTNRVDKICPTSNEAAIDCKRNKKHALCPNWKKGGDKTQKGKRFKCAANEKPTCPPKTSSGECVNEKGKRSKPRCDATDKTIKPLQCHKEKNQSEEICKDKKGPICPNTEAPPTCKDGSHIDLSPYKTPLDVVPQALVLNQRRPGHGPPHGNGNRPPRGHPKGPGGPKRNPPKEQVFVDFLCLKVDLN